MILQPELEKKFGFNLATLLTGITWWLWHFQYFYKRTVNINMNYFLFGIMCLTLSYVGNNKISEGVFCILTHCLINGLSAIFVFNFSLLSCCVSLIATIVTSLMILNINKRYAS